MDEYNQYLEKKYKETYDVIYKTTMKQVKEGKATKESVEALLRDQYIFCDQDWLGRGEIKDTVNQATIAALETILVNWSE